PRATWPSRMSKIPPMSTRKPPIRTWPRKNATPAETVTAKPRVVIVFGWTPRSISFRGMGRRIPRNPSRIHPGMKLLTRCSDSGEDDPALVARLNSPGDLLVDPLHQAVEVGLRRDHALIDGHLLERLHQILIFLLLLLLRLPAGAQK